MRTITTHQTNAVNEAIAIEADDRDPKNGNASHIYWLRYTLKAVCEEDDFRATQRVGFQHGPIAEHGVNGITNEALLAIVADRLEGFQSSLFACEENEAALKHVTLALAALHERTTKRLARGVEGRNVP